MNVLGTSDYWELLDNYLFPDPDFDLSELLETKFVLKRGTVIRVGDKWQFPRFYKVSRTRGPREYITFTVVAIRDGEMYEGICCYDPDDRQEQGTTRAVAYGFPRKLLELWEKEAGPREYGTYKTLGQPLFKDGSLKHMATSKYGNSITLHRKRQELSRKPYDGSNIHPALAGVYEDDKEDFLRPLRSGAKEDKKRGTDDFHWELD